MSLQWVRLWLDMPTDPKWRAVARRSGQRIGDVIAVYTHMMCQARVADTPGHLDGWDDEDVAAALDLDPADVQAIRDAMQGKVLDGDYLSGWTKRQPSREDDGAVDRKRKQREKERTARDGAARHDVSRNVTHGHAPDADSDADADAEQQPSRVDTGRGLPSPADQSPPCQAAAGQAGDDAGDAKPDIADACRRIVKAWDNPNGPSVSRLRPTVEKWLVTWGCDLENEVLPAIREVVGRRRAKGEGPPNKLTYFDGRVWEIHEERTSKPPDSSAGQATNGHDQDEDPEHSRWRARLAAYRDRGMWVDQWGDRPDERRCQAPHDVLVEFGYRQDARRAAG